MQTYVGVVLTVEDIAAKKCSAAVETLEAFLLDFKQSPAYSKTLRRFRKKLRVREIDPNT